MSDENGPNILIVEDNPLDAQLTLWALGQAGYDGHAVVVNDGSEAIAFFKHEAPFEDVVIPDLVILDLNLRLVDGPEVLRFIRERPELERIKVAILSSSPDYVMRTKAGKADFYFSKSSSLDVYAELGKKILDCYQSSGYPGSKDVL